MLPEGFANKIPMNHVGFKCLEIYDSARYFTMTGDIYGEPKSIQTVNMRELKIPTMQPGGARKSAAPASPQHDYLIRQIRESEDGSGFAALFDHGDLTRYEGDQSRADLALAGIIAKWTKFDPQLTDGIYRQSALMRPKWDKRHKSDGSTYGEMTIRKALDNKRIASEREHEGFLQYHYDFRYNAVTSRTEVHMDGGWQMLDDYNFNSIHRHMRNRGAKVSAQKLHSLLGSDFVEKYHPFKEYFHNLPKWDDTDWIGKLAGKVRTKDSSYWTFCLRKWLVALVASALEDDVVNQTVLILQGGQGIGKSTFLLGLCPEALSEYFYSGNLNPSNKDSIINLSETIICQLDELETLTKYKEGALKELITKSEIRIRRPYGRFADTMTRHASLCGSINQGTMLHDPTGSRRFLIHKVRGIDYQHEVDIDKVYAQALHLYREGFQYWFDGKQIQRINAHNKQFETQSVEEELLLQHYRKADVNEVGADRLRATEILKRLNDGSLPSGSHGASIRLGQALSKHNFKCTRSKGSTYWWVRRKNDFLGKPSTEDASG